MANLRTEVTIKNNYTNSNDNYQMGDLVRNDGDVGIIIDKRPTMCEIYFFNDNVIGTEIEISNLSPFIGTVILQSRFE